MAATAKAQAPTAAERHAQLKEQQFEQFLESSFTAQALKGEALFEVKTPLGSVYKCRRPSPELSVFISASPLGMSRQLTSAADPLPADVSDEEREKAAAEAFMALSEQEQQEAVERAKRTLRYIAVEPRIVPVVNGHRDAIALAALTGAEIKHLAVWAGGGAAQGLKTFRKKRR